MTERAADQEFTSYDRYLIREYHKHGSTDYYLCDIGYKTFVVPLRYVAKAKDGVEANKLFKAALLDFQKEDLLQYERHNRQPRLIKINDDKFVIPYNTPNDWTPRQIADSIMDRIEGKYHAVINAHRMLHEITSTDFSTLALNRYTKKLASQNKTLLLAPDAIKNLEIYQSLCRMIKEQGKKASPHIIKAIKKIRTKILQNEFKALKKYKPKHWKLALLGGMFSVSAYHLYHSFNQPEPEPLVPPFEISIDTTKVFTDFKGDVYSDSIGNLKQMRDLQPQIMTTLIALEGFSENTFLDGRGNPTIGSGFTVTINPDGSTQRVKEGDKTTIEEDVIQNTRYIEREFSNILGDKIEKILNPEEIYACIGAGYCWGTDKFVESSFFKSLKNNEPISEQCRKLSGFRKPKGLIKREFVLAQLLSSNWKVEDLLDMPIYYVKDKGYVHCGIYTLDFHDCVPCKKDKKGHYLKDTKGYEIPIIDQDGFCQKFYQPSFKEVLDKIHKHPMNRGIPYKTVRQLLHKDLLAKLNIQNKESILTIHAFNAIDSHRSN